MMSNKALRIIISGGGTGGHIFPAISIAKKMKELNPDSEILFVGAEGKMEMEKVPAAGFKIIGLPIVGLQRQLNLHNIINDLKAPFKVLYSIRKAGKIIREFKPDIAIGVGGYASAPLLWAAERQGIPTLIQEQNGFAGLTNKILGKKAGRICVAYEGMDKFFPADKIVLTGNPIRKEIVPATAEMKEEGLKYYGLNAGKRHILITGGSLGSGTLNKAVKKWIEDGCPGGNDIEILWQCGKYYKAGVDASTVSELCAAHKAAIFVPSPNVAEDHQTHNAMALVRKGAAVLVKDADAPEKLMAEAVALAADESKLKSMQLNIARLARTDAADVIAKEAYELVENK